MALSAQTGYTVPSKNYKFGQKLIRQGDETILGDNVNKSTVAEEKREENSEVLLHKNP